MYRFSIDRTACWMYEYEVGDQLYWKAIETEKNGNIVYYDDKCHISLRSQELELICIEDKNDLSNGTI